MRQIGFSSGAIAYGDFLQALRTLQDEQFPCLELSALRISELEPLLATLPNLDLSKYSYVSVHAPSTFSREQERWVADMLYSRVPEQWPIIMHPDAIHDYACWTRFGRRLAIENMDRRKPIGRTAGELKAVFEHLPEASLCFDVGHARQCDASMTEAFLILSTYSMKLVQVHISEVNSASQHDAISRGACLAFRRIADLIPAEVPIIIESRVLPEKIAEEARNAENALSALPIR